MPKSRGRKKKLANRPAPKSDLVLMSSPSGAQHDALRVALMEVSRKSAEAMPGLLARVETLFKDTYPPQLMAALAAHGLYGSVQKDGTIKTPWSEAEFIQHHAELLQALMLRLRRSDWGSNPLVPDKLTEAVDLISKIAQGFQFLRVTQIEKATTEEAKLQLQIQERLRGMTQSVRNWGNFSQVVAHTKDLYARLDTPFAQNLGVSATSIIDALLFMLRTTEDRNTERMNMLAQIYKAKGVRAKLEKYWALRPDLVGTPQDLEAAIEGVSEQQAMFMIMSHSDLALTDMFSFTSDEIATGIGVDTENISKALDNLSITPGELASENVDHFFLGNPVWFRPLIKISDGGYFSILPQAFFSHVHRIFRALCEKLNLAKELSEARAQYLEDRAYALLKRALPQGDLRANASWIQQGQRFENDVLCVIDRTLIVVECKSGSISEASLRGAPDSTKRHVQELLLEPSLQSYRLEKLIEAAQHGEMEADTILRQIGIAPDKISRVIRLTVTLEDFSPLAPAERELKAVGWIESNHALAPAMTLADLEVVLEILISPTVFAHYLQGRGRMQRTYDVVGDELDWLGFYLISGFALQAEKPIDALMLTGMSKPIDDYYNALDAGVVRKKPAFPLSPLWRQTLNETERRQFDGWLDVSLALLSCASPAEQAQFERNFDKVRQRVPAIWKKDSHKCAGMVVPPWENATAVAFFAYPPQLAKERKSRADQIAASMFERKNVVESIIFGFDTSKVGAAYFFIASYRQPS